jgi:uncharacterized protein YlxP (DUF503 family)
VSPAVGVLILELHIEDAHSLKDKRNVVNSLKERLRAKFNVSVAEIDGHDTWQRSVVAVAAVSKDRPFAEQMLQAAERESAHQLGGMLAGSAIEWL